MGGGISSTIGGGAAYSYLQHFLQIWGYFTLTYSSCFLRGKHFTHTYSSSYKRVCISLTLTAVPTKGYAFHSHLQQFLQRGGGGGGGVILLSLTAVPTKGGGISLEIVFTCRRSVQRKIFWPQ